MAEFIKNRGNFADSELFLLNAIADFARVNSDVIKVSTPNFPCYIDGNCVILYKDICDESTNIIFNQFVQNRENDPSVKSVIFLGDYEEAILKCIANDLSYSFTQIMEYKYNENRKSSTKKTGNFQLDIINTHNNKWKIYEKFLMDNNEDCWFYKNGFEIKKILTEKCNINWFYIGENETMYAVVGAVILNKTIRLLEIETHVLYRRKGYFSSLINHIIDYYKDYNLNNIVLFVDRDNEIAKNAYLKNGFEFTNIDFLTVRA